MWQDITSQELSTLLDKLRRAADAWALVDHYQTKTGNWRRGEAWFMYREMSDAARYALLSAADSR